MIAPVYDRICGWVFAVLALFGLVHGHIGSYFYFSRVESWMYLSVGVLGMFGARSKRERYAVAIAATMGISLLTMALEGLARPSSLFGTAEPLDTITRLVAGCWGIYVSIQDVQMWRHPEVAD